MNGQAYTWDNNSNLLNDGLLTYAYDQANRLKTVTQGANTYTFAYNGLGDRLSQTVGVTQTRYALDPAAGLIQVLSDGTNTYLYGNGRIAQYQTAMQYFGADALGSVRQIYSASGQVVANARYDSFGNIISQNNSATSTYGFSGEWMNSNLRLLYLHVLPNIRCKRFPFQITAHLESNIVSIPVRAATTTTRSRNAPAR